MASWKKNKWVGIIAGVVFIGFVVLAVMQVRKASQPPAPNYVSVIMKWKTDVDGNPYEVGIPIEEAKEKYGYTIEELKKMDYEIVLESPNEVKHTIK